MPPLQVASAVQLPLTQAWPGVQLVVQPPQAVVSVLVFLQVSPHRVSPAAQVAALHAPAEQNSPVLHDVPQAPQLRGSAARFLHDRPHGEVPGSQVIDSMAVLLTRPLTRTRTTLKNGEYPSLVGTTSTSGCQPTTDEPSRDSRNRGVPVSS